MADDAKTPKARKSTKSSNTYYEGVGRRKTAVARVRVFSTKKGSATIGETTYKAGSFMVDGKLLGDVFLSKADQMRCMRPLMVSDAVDQYVVLTKVYGGGLSGQVDAISHGLARALSTIPSQDLKLKLRVAGLLTRDSRTRERRMVGTGGKSRRLKQSPKR